MSTESPTTLPACPFCGSANVKCSDGFLEDGYFAVYCADCKTGTASFPTSEGAIAAWSRRTASVGADAAAKANRVADCLFENGQGQHADRLVLTKDATGHAPGQNAKDLGGWCKQSVVDAILAEFGSASPSDAAEICAEKD